VHFFHALALRYLSGSGPMLVSAFVATHSQDSLVWVQASMCQNLQYAYVQNLLLKAAARETLEVRGQGGMRLQNKLSLWFTNNTSKAPPPETILPIIKCWVGTENFSLFGCFFFHLFIWHRKNSCSVQVDPSSTPMDLLNVTQDSSLCNLTPIDLLSARDRLHLEREERATARLQCRWQREQWSEQAEIGKAG